MMKLWMQSFREPKFGWNVFLAVVFYSILALVFHVAYWKAAIATVAVDVAIGLYFNLRASRSSREE